MSDSVNDRRWQFYCTTGGNVAGVNSTCTIQVCMRNSLHLCINSPPPPPPPFLTQPAINTPGGGISYVCPGTSYIGGLFSTYNLSASDRIWQPYCCVRPYSSLISCTGEPAFWSNLLRANLNYSAGDPNVITGLYNFYSSLDLLVLLADELHGIYLFLLLRDRRWRFSTCQIQG